MPDICETARFLDKKLLVGTSGILVIHQISKQVKTDLCTVFDVAFSGVLSFFMLVTYKLKQTQNVEMQKFS